MPRSTTLLALSAALALALASPPAASARHYDSLLDPTGHCRAAESTAAPAAQQEAAMACLHNYARRRRGLAALRTSSLLQSSAGSKAGHIMRCQDFSHWACDRSDAFYWQRRVGYARGSWSGGENIAWGGGHRGTARSIMSLWLHSDGHRRNILTSSFRDGGHGLVRGRFQGYSGVGVWVAHLGRRG